MTLQEQDRVVLLTLAQAGWRVQKYPEGMVALREFDTAVGPKEAQIRINPASGERPSRWVQPSYWSEGRNVLSTCSMYLPLEADKAQTQEMIKDCLTQMQHRIDTSYARGLYLAA